MTFLIAYAMTALVFFAIDVVWLTQIAGPFYFAQLGDLMRDDVLYGIAGAFYAFYVVGIVYFCVLPALKDGGWRLAAFNGALLGAIAYATYDLTNLATIKGWPPIVAVVDITWGAVLTATSAGLGYALTSRFVKRG